MSLLQLKALMKENNISINSYMTKSDMLTKLEQAGILPKLPTIERKPIPRPVESKSTESKSTDLKYVRLKSIRVNPRKVMIRDLETGEVKTYNSIYKANKELCHNVHHFAVNNRKVLDGRYEVTIEDPPGEAAPLQVPTGEAAVQQE